MPSVFVVNTGLRGSAQSTDPTQHAWCPATGSANHHMIDQVARTAPAARDIPLIRNAHAEYLDCLGKVDEHLKQTGNEFIVGNQLSVGDVPLAVSTR